MLFRSCNFSPFLWNKSRFIPRFKSILNWLNHFIMIHRPLMGYWARHRNRPFSKMTVTDLNELKLNWIKNWYQKQREHLYFSNPAKFQRIRCYISHTPVRHTPNHTNVCTCFNFSADITPDMPKLCRVTKVKVLFLFLVVVFEFSGAILEKSSSSSSSSSSLFKLGLKSSVMTIVF